LTLQPRTEESKAQPVVFLDLDGYLTEQHNKIIGKAIGDSLKAAEEDAMRAQMQWEQDDWDNSKKEVCSDHRRFNL